MVRHWSQSRTIAHGSSSQNVLLELDEDWNLENLGIAIVVINPDNGETLQALNTPLRSLYVKPESNS